jgi:hypothetical protein
VIPPIAANETYGDASMKSTLVLNAWPAWSPGDSPHIAHALAIRGDAATSMAAIIVNPAFNFIMTNLPARPNYIRYTSTNSTGQTAQTKYQYTAHSSIPALLRAL